MKAKRKAEREPLPPSDSYMKRLARETGLTFDGDDDRLFAETIHVFDRDVYLSEDAYDAYEESVNEFVVKGKGFICYAWNDCGGYMYWGTDESDETFDVFRHDTNYIQITVQITDNNVDVEKVKAAVEKAQNKFHRYGDR